jgi:hypothetical protein
VPILAQHVEHEFFWEKKCKELENCRPEDHGGSFKQAYIELYVQKLIEGFRAEGNLGDLEYQLSSVRFDVFKLEITELLSHLSMEVLFRHLPNLTDLCITFGAKHVGMEYESSLFGMKMVDAEVFKDCI